MSDTFIAKAGGSKADIKSKVNINKVYDGYFSSDEVINTFIKVGIAPLLEKLPEKVSYADFGGGTGTLSLGVKKFLESQGKIVDAVVIDSNKDYLAAAEKSGLKTSLQNLDSISDKNHYDLITMRSVLHYNTFDDQIKIIANVKKALKPGGFFVNQNISGNDKYCELRTKIVSIPELGRWNAGGFHWISEEKYHEVMIRGGFDDCTHAGYAEPLGWTPEEQWARFNPEGDPERKKIFLTKAYELVKEYRTKYFQGNTKNFQDQPDGSVKLIGPYPIYVCNK